MRVHVAVGASLFTGAALLFAAPEAPKPRPTVPGLSHELFAKVTDLLATGIRSVGLPPDACDAGAPPGPRKSGAACASYYDRMFEDGEFNMGVGLGYIDPAVDFASSTQRFATIVENLTKKTCPKGAAFACGFTRKDVRITGPDGKPMPGTDVTVLMKTFPYRDSKGKLKTVTARINLCNPYSPSRDPVLQKLQQTTCAALFAQSMKYDDVTAYAGHSRYGSGPDFFPAVTKKTKKVVNKGTPKEEVIEVTDADHDYYAKRRDGVDRFFSAEALSPGAGSKFPRPPYKQLYMLSCDSYSHFGKGLKAASKAAGYDPRSFDFMGTDHPADVNGTETVRLIESLGTGACAGALSAAVAGRDDDRFDQTAEPDPATGESLYQISLRPPKLRTPQLFNAVE